MANALKYLVIHFRILKATILNKLLRFRELFCTRFSLYVGYYIMYS